VASVHWTVGAREDLEEIVEYIRRDSPTSATALAQRIVAGVRTLRRYPRVGRVVPEYRDEAVRELIIGNYRVVYRLLDGASTSWRSSTGAETCSVVSRQSRGISDRLAALAARSAWSGFRGLIPRPVLVDRDDAESPSPTRTVKPAG